MSSINFLFSCIVINIFCILFLFSINYIEKQAYPQYIASSYDFKSKIEFDSVILKSLSPILKYILPLADNNSRHVGILPIGNKELNISNYTFISSENESDIISNSTNTKYEMLISHTDFEKLFILKMHNSYTDKNSIISLYQIPTVNFKISYRSEFSMKQSIIEKLWEMRIPGMTTLHSISNDKKYACLVYQVLKGNVITYRIRYFPFVDKQFINDNINDTNYNKQFYSILPNNNSFDDFAIEGNIEITSLTVGEKKIAFTRANNNTIILLIRNESQWEIKEFKTSNYEKGLLYYYYTTLLRFGNEETSFNLYHQFIEVTAIGIFAGFQYVKYNQTTESFSFHPLIYTQLDRTMSDTEKKNNVTFIYKMDLVLKKLTKYLHPTTHITTFNSSNFIFEFYQSALCSVDEVKLDYEIIDSIERKIDYITADYKQNHIIVKYSDGNIYYYYRKKDKELYEERVEVLFNSLPKKFKIGNILTFTIEQFHHNKIILFILMNNGNIISLDFSNLIQKLDNSFLNKVGFSLFLIISANITFSILYCKKRKKMNQHAQQNIFNINLANGGINNNNISRDVAQIFFLNQRVRQQININIRQNQQNVPPNININNQEIH